MTTSMRTDIIERRDPGTSCISWQQYSSDKTFQHSADLDSTDVEIWNGGDPEVDLGQSQQCCGAQVY